MTLKTYEVDYTYNLPEWGTHIQQANSPEEADDLTFEFLSAEYPDAVDIEIESVKEVRRDQ